MFQSTLKSHPNEDISILIQPENHPWNYLCECGEASDLTVKEIQNSNAIFISHTHIDHFINFDSVIRHQIGIGRRVVICGPKGIAKQVHSKLLGYTWNLIERGSIIYEIREVMEDEINFYEVEPPLWDLKLIKSEKGNLIFEEKNFFVTGTLLDHKIPVLAYKFQEKDTIKIDLSGSGFRGGKWIQELKTAFEQNAPGTAIEVNAQRYEAKDLFHLLSIKTGDSLGVIMDHAANEENHKKIRSHFQGCRKVFIECFYKDDEKEFADKNFHSHASSSGKIMAETGVKEAIPVHFSRRYKEEDRQELITAFQSAFAQD